MHRTLTRIGAELREGARHETITSPYDGSAVGEVAIASEEDLDAAIDWVARGFETMRRLPTHERARILERTAELLVEHCDELVELIARESGKPVKLGRGEVERAVLTFRLAAGEARTFGGEVLPIDLEARAEGMTGMYRRVPRGPQAAISPFNFPLNLIVHKLAPAIAIGTSTVLKPPHQCPLTGFRLGELLLEAGLPPEGLAIVHCEGERAQRLVEDERLKILSFTGSDSVGWRLKGLAGKKQVLLELGGNAPCIVDQGTDLDSAMGPILGGAWAHGGQVCIKVQRLLVHEELHDSFLERFIAETKELGVGDPLREDTLVGPLIEQRHVGRVLEWVEEARSGGATVHCGGEADGSVLQPTILTGVTPRMRVCREEIFGPVTVVEPFSDFDEALARCNQTRFGLQAGIFTRDLGRAMRAFDVLDYGGVMINSVPTFRVDSFPYGGSKDSGFGREGVRFAMEEMTEHKVLVLAPPGP